MSKSASNQNIYYSPTDQHTIYTLNKKLYFPYLKLYNANKHHCCSLFATEKIERIAPTHLITQHCRCGRVGGIHC